MVRLGLPDVHQCREPAGPEQDRRVLDYCDRHGILIQTEVPTWGPKTFEGVGEQPAEAIMQNGLEQLREMSCQYCSIGLKLTRF